jgi:hypothetical protein
MRAHVLDMWCLRSVSLLQVTTKFILGWNMWMWRMPKLTYKKPLLRLKSQGKGDKNGNGLLLKVAYDIKN